MKLIIGLLLGFAIGALCKIFAIPVPAPPVVEGAILVVAMTVGYGLVDYLLEKPAKSKTLCGGPSGQATTPPNRQHEEEEHE
jgi:XapX domain-containing protein